MRNRKYRADRVKRIIIEHHPDEFGNCTESEFVTEGFKPNQVIRLVIKLLKSIYKRKRVSGVVELEEQRHVNKNI